VKYPAIFFFFLIYVGCPGQLTRTTTIPHGPLDILQAQEQVRHRGGDRRTHRGSNPGRGRNKSHELTTAVKPSSAGYTRELEPGHSGRAKPAKATELQAPCVIPSYFNISCNCNCNVLYTSNFRIIRLGDQNNISKGIKRRFNFNLLLGGYRIGSALEKIINVSWIV